MQEHEYKARDKTVQKMSRDGLREKNLRSKKENTDCSPNTLFWNRKNLQKRKKWKTQK